MAQQTSASPRAVTTVGLKGGTTKTTISINVAQQLGESGHDVCFIDTDTNGHATHRLGFDDLYFEPETEWADVLLDGGDAAPEDLIHSTEYAFDILPASTGLESLKSQLAGEMRATLTLRDQVVDPLLGAQYDYFVIDTGSDRDILLNNAVAASFNLMIPLVAETGASTVLNRTRTRIIEPLRDKPNVDLDVLAYVPNKLQERFDQQTADRQLVERLCTTAGVREKVPNFAYYTEEEFEQIDAGELHANPGLRKDKAFDGAEPVSVADPENPQLPYLNELAEIVEEGGVQR